MTSTLGISMPVRLSQFSNKELLIRVRPWGSVTLDRLLHPEKAELPISVTLSGISTLVRAVE